MKIKDKRKWLSLYRYQELYPNDFILYEKPDYREDNRTCKWCGQPLPNKRRKSYCSNECKWKFERETVWERGHAPLPYRILCRDNFECGGCGDYIGMINEYGIKIPTGVGAEVHHVIPVSEGGTDHQDNLISLCVSCHLKAHGKVSNKNVV